MALSTGDRASEIVYADDAILQGRGSANESSDRITIISILPVPTVG